MLKGNDFHIIVLSPALLGQWQPMGSSRQPRQQVGGPGPWEQQGFPQCLLGLGVSAKLVVVPGWYPAVG